MEKPVNNKYLEVLNTNEPFHKDSVLTVLKEIQQGYLSIRDTKELEEAIKWVETKNGYKPCLPYLKLLNE